MKAKTSVSHSRRVIEEPRADPALAREYLKAAVEEIDEPGGREALLVALRHIVEAQGGVGKLAAATGLRRKVLYRALSIHGNPTLKTFLMIVKMLGLRIDLAQQRGRAA